MWGLRTYIKPYLKFVILAPLFMLLEVFFDLQQPKFAAYIVNFGIIKRNVHIIAHTGELMVMMTGLSLFFGVGCNLLASRASQNFGADIREALYTKVQTFSFENLDAFQSGSLITRMTNDVVQVQTLLQLSLQGLVRAPGLLIGSVVMAMVMSFQLGLILLAALLILVAVLFLLIRFSYPLFSSVQAKLDAVNTRIQENLAGIRVVKAFARSRHEAEKFAKTNKDYADSAIKASLVIALNSPIVTLIMNTGLVIILLYGGKLVWLKDFQVGVLVAFVNYVAQALSSLLMMSGLLMNVSQASVSAGRIGQVLAAKPKIENAPNVKDAALPAQCVKFDNVGFSYGSSQRAGDSALRSVSFEACRGETIAIIGATGSGKSTLIQLIPRLYEVTAGSIQIDGKDIRDLPLLEMRRKIGLVLQESFLFTGSIRENIAFGKPDAPQAEIEAAARIAQAHDFISKLPGGYETKVGQKGVNLSGGQKQRIAIARALLIKPPILILDDSTSALDLETEKRLRRALKQLTQESVTFIIAQRISSVADARKILILDDGTIAGCGTHHELLETCEVYQEIYKSQFGRKEAAYVPSRSQLSCQ